jgi:hypothetical protein
VMGTLPPAGRGGLDGEEEDEAENRAQSAHWAEYYTGYGGW